MSPSETIIQEILAIAAELTTVAECCSCGDVWTNMITERTNEAANRAWRKLHATDLPYALTLRTAAHFVAESLTGGRHRAGLEQDLRRIQGVRESLDLLLAKLRREANVIYLQNQVVVDAAGRRIPSLKCVALADANRLLNYNIGTAWDDMICAGVINTYAKYLNTPDTPISVEHAALRLDISTSSVRKLLATGKLSGRKLGRTWHVNAANVDYYKSGRKKTQP